MAAKVSAALRAEARVVEVAMVRGREKRALLWAVEGRGCFQIML